ncbi:MAG TPA: phospholipase [Ktedonobacteraceae bacterium]|nr:phospholipase [Ktedonobacteraceae bacterium]
MEHLQGANKITGPHQGQRVLVTGKPLERAKAAMIMIHGRGASAEDILRLASEVKQTGFIYLAPQAAGHSWYPHSFLAPLASNEPGISSGLTVIASLFERLTDAGIGPERTILLGFSQGACLSLEFASRNARRYGGVVGLSGGLIGPDGTKRDYPGSLQETPIFLGCSDRDMHIPKERVLFSSEVLQQQGGRVITRLYPHMGHTVNDDELEAVRAMMASLAAV